MNDIEIWRNRKRFEISEKNKNRKLKQHRLEGKEMPEIAVILWSKTPPKTLPKWGETTMDAVFRLKRATALQISEKTGKARAVESHYLNLLVLLNLLRKERKNREVFFEIL